MSKSAPVPPPKGHGYDEDFYAWALGSTTLPRAKRFSDIDTTRLAAAHADAIDETGLADSVFPERYPFAGDSLLDAESWPE